METAIVKSVNSLAIQGWESQVDLIKRTVAKGATNDELSIFLHQCRKTGLDPLAKQIYFQKRKNNKTGEFVMTIITGIDGYRLVADRTGKYAGNDDPEYDDAEEQPKWAKVTVYKMVEGQRCPFTATARWSQYYPGEALGFMWKRMPHLMLGKCAEALALRKAFPAELSGLYTDSEMQQADRHEIPEYAEEETKEVVLQCEDCQSPIRSLSKNGEIAHSYSEVLNRGRDKHGLDLCWDCQVAREKPKANGPQPFTLEDVDGELRATGYVYEVKQGFTGKNNKFMFTVHMRDDRGQEVRLSTFSESLAEELAGIRGKVCTFIVDQKVKDGRTYYNITSQYDPLAINAEDTRLVAG